MKIKPKTAANKRRFRFGKRITVKFKPSQARAFGKVTVEYPHHD